jgi:hypothetical protein
MFNLILSAYIGGVIAATLMTAHFTLREEIAILRRAKHSWTFVLFALVVSFAISLLWPLLALANVICWFIGRDPSTLERIKNA